MSEWMTYLICVHEQDELDSSIITVVGLYFTSAPVFSPRCCVSSLNTHVIAALRIPSE